MEIIQSITSVPWSNLFYTAREVFVFFDILLVVGIVFFTFRALSLRPKFRVFRTHFDRRISLKGDEGLKKRWREIIKKSSSQPPQSYSLAIIEADTFVDSLLLRIGLEGKTMKEKLDQLDTEELATLNTLWRVHRIRNMLVHTPGFTLSESQALEVLQGYEAFLKELEIV